MAKVQRANVILDINDADIDYYLTTGYNVIDERGNVITATVPMGITTLQKCYREHIAKIEELEAKVAELTAESTKRSTKTSSKKSATTNAE